MVKHLHITLDDAEHERITAVKKDAGMTWREFLVAASEAFQAQE